MKWACVHACVCFCMFTQLSWIVAELQCISLKRLFHKWKNVLQDFSICKGSGDKWSLFGVTFPRSKDINLLWGKQLHCELNYIEEWMWWWEHSVERRGGFGCPSQTDRAAVEFNETIFYLNLFKANFLLIFCSFPTIPIWACIKNICPFACLLNLLHGAFQQKTWIHWCTL